MSATSQPSKVKNVKKNFTAEVVANYQCEVGKSQSIYWDAKTTGLGLEALMPGLVKAESLGMIQRNATHWQVLPFGRRFTNDLQALFL